MCLSNTKILLKCEPKNKSRKPFATMAFLINNPVKIFINEFGLSRILNDVEF